jgi:hypothetical protein
LLFKNKFIYKFVINKSDTNERTLFSKYLYIGFLLLGLYQAIFSKDYVQAAASLGIGLAFDPFNPEQKWNDRPTWQKAVMIIHLALVAAMFGFGIGLNDK